MPRGIYGRRSNLDRFLDNTIVSITGCLEWTACKNDRGYGIFWMNNENMRANRASWEIFHGAIPPGKLVLHLCDNTGCVSPACLWLGDIQDNSDDKLYKGRQAKGENQGLSRMTEEKVIEARDLYEKGYKIRALARKFGISQSPMQQILRRTTWKHI